MWSLEEDLKSRLLLQVKKIYSIKKSNTIKGLTDNGDKGCHTESSYNR